MVTVNYRLGALGQLASKTLLTGNFAIQDQIMALNWVKNHIVVFGGDQDRVTIFGWSAGSQSACIAILFRSDWPVFRSHSPKRSDRPPMVQR